ncbi:hypothetical protein [Deinococcus ficus]|jgi:hypothetical protein|uniref:hypothetical protein n=1 Tax=Deinococcus ficus TaxID=317577 RepID=UPI0003B4E6EF|nr:hypothetical protein [Deinococcus ficus]
MSARPEFLALKEFGTLRYDVNEDGWWPLVQAIMSMSSPLSDDEVRILVLALDPAGHDLYGVVFCFLDLIRDSPGWPGNVLSLNLPDDSVWNAVLIDSARGLAP